jgi:pyruvate/2-oxoglutarate/acetoin dehydrogenase E1 component
VGDCLKAADELGAASISAEVIDIRTLVPLDTETIFASVRKTGRCLVVSQCVDIGSFTGEIVSQVTAACFDDLDAPPIKVGAKNGIAPQAYTLEQAFLPSVAEIVTAARSLI